MSLQVRKAFESDKQAISDVVIAAFGDVQGQEIADLITGLLADPSAQPLLSLVVTADDNVVGHILFTNARMKHSQRIVSSAILAPLSVHPDYQNQGIGGQLIKEGLKQMKAAGVELVFVLGHPGYYPKYGFSAAGIEGFDAPYPIPPENSGAWMVQELHPGVIGHVSGRVICADALNDPVHWRE
jgi:predicted N-acetyltransferase YhbS